MGYIRKHTKHPRWFRPVWEFLLKQDSHLSYNEIVAGATLISDKRKLIETPLCPSIYQLASKLKHMEEIDKKLIYIEDSRQYIWRVKDEYRTVCDTATN